MVERRQALIGALLVFFSGGCAAKTVRLRPLAPVDPPRYALTIPSRDGCLPTPVEEAWAGLREGVREMTWSPTKDASKNLYSAQVHVAPFLMAIDRCNRLDLADSLADTLTPAFEKVRHYAYIGSQADERTLLTWRAPGEGELGHPLSVAQFLHPVSVLLRIAATHDVEPHPALQRLLSYASTVRDHYLAIALYDRSWLRGYGSPHTHAELVRVMRARPETAHVTDLDLWIIAGITELLAAHQARPDLVPLAPVDRARLEAHVVEGALFFSSRLRPTQLTSFTGTTADGLVLEPGRFAEHEDYRFAGYEGRRFPDDGDAAAVPTVAWDLSHMRRLVVVLDTLRRRRDVTGLAFPNEETIQKLANQFAYRVFNRNFEKPAFSNFFDGANGWYRVGYVGREGFAYGPSDLSQAALDGGYGFWGDVSPDVQRIGCALLAMLRSTDPEVVAHREATYGVHWSKGERRSTLHWRAGTWEQLSFYATFAGRLTACR